MVRRVSDASFNNVDASGTNIDLVAETAADDIAAAGSTERDIMALQDDATISAGRHAASPVF